MTTSSSWTFVTNHAVVLLVVFEEPEITLREIADRTGITERAAHRIVADLVEEGYLVVRKVGRRNAYEVVGEAPLRHRGARHVEVGALLELLRHR